MITPNAGLSLENLIFDPTYYALSFLIVILTISSSLVALYYRGRLKEAEQTSLATAMVLIALGFAAIFLIAISVLALFRAGVLGGFQYLQLQFVLVYFGCALVYFGILKSFLAIRVQNSELGPKQFSKARIGPWAILWILFLVSVGVSLAYLFDPQTYTVTMVGGTEHVAQETIFWFPPFLTCIVGAVGLLFLARRRVIENIRQIVLLALFFLSEIVGMVKESNLLSSSGDPFVDLLLAFLPFAMGSFFLILCAIQFRRLTGQITSRKLNLQKRLPN